jgi:hypothetical protein
MVTNSELKNAIRSILGQIRIAPIVNGFYTTARAHPEGNALATAGHNVVTFTQLRLE